MKGFPFDTTSDMPTQFTNRRPMGEPEVSYLMPHSRRPYGFPVSRDWEDIDCKAVGCQFNRGEKCQVPTARQAKEVAADKAEREKLYHGIG
jgi:hypothetical protein